MCAEEWSFAHAYGQNCGHNIGGGEYMYMRNANGLYYIHRMLSIVGEQERAYLVLKLNVASMHRLLKY